MAVGKVGVGMLKSGKFVGKVGRKFVGKVGSVKRNFLPTELKISKKKKKKIMLPTVYHLVGNGQCRLKVG
jgi:hypothetical protein